MTTWTKQKLGDVLEKVVGGGTPSKSNLQYWGGAIPWASVKDFEDGRYYLDSTQDYITQEGLDNSASNFVSAGTIVMPTRMGLGRVVKTTIGTAINQDLKAVYPNEKINNDFLLWTLIYSGIKLQNIGNGSTVTGIRLEDLRNIIINLPDLKTQVQISSVLSAYNDLIENNEKRIKILEEMAQTLYTEWFIKFNFPGHENVKMIDSLLGKIPEGWEVKKLSDILELAYGKALKEDSRVNGNISVYGSSGRVGFHNEKFVPGPGIVIGRKGNIGSVFWVKNDFYPIDTTYYVKSSLNLEFIYYLLKSQSYIAGDAAVPGLNRSYVYGKKIIVPPNSLLNQFTINVQKIFNLRDNLEAQSYSLEKICDILIPQLVTGMRELKS